MAGRIVLCSAYVMAISGIWMHNVLSPESQGARYFVLIFTSMMICLAFSIALLHIIQRNIRAHQIWMARAVAITLAAVTPLFVDVVIMVLFGTFDHLLELMTQLQYDYGRLLGMAINLTIAEVFMRKKHTKHIVDADQKADALS